jgi:hypothetical protein
VNYTDRESADRGVSHGQCGGSPTAVILVSRPIKENKKLLTSLHVLGVKPLRTQLSPQNRLLGSERGKQVSGIFNDENKQQQKSDIRIKCNGISLLIARSIRP